MWYYKDRPGGKPDKLKTRHVYRIIDIEGVLMWQDVLESTL
jgi:hypothetical protein